MVAGVTKTSPRWGSRTRGTDLNLEENWAVVGYPSLCNVTLRQRRQCGPIVPHISFAPPPGDPLQQGAVWSWGQQLWASALRDSQEWAPALPCWAPQSLPSRVRGSEAVQVNPYEMPPRLSVIPKWNSSWGKMDTDSNLLPRPRGWLEEATAHCLFR